MQLSSHLRLSRHGVWCFRLVLPDAVATAIGQREIIKSLSTKRPEVARLTAYSLSATLVPLLRKLRRVLTIDPNSIDPKNVRELIIKGIRREGNTVSAEHVETTRKDPEGMEHERRIVDSLFSLDAPPPKFSEAEMAYVQEGRDELMRLFGAKEPDIPETLKAAIDGFMGTKAGLSEATKKLYKARLGVFTQLIGGPDKMVHAITAADCVKASEALQRMPANVSKRKVQPPQARSTPIKPKAVATTKEKPLPILASGTVKDSLALWQDFFKWAIGARRYTEANPIEGITRPATSANEAGAEPFSEAELLKIFQPAVLMARKRPSQFWGPLIGLFTGCRSNEIAQLRLSDIVVDSGIKCFRMIHDPKGNPPTILKNTASARTLPIHPKLWQLGFQAYLDDLAAIGANRLFPNLPADKNGKREKGLSRDFNEGLLVEVGVYQTRTKVMHSFRDTATGALVDGKLHPSHIEDWMGHARKGTEGKHYVTPQTTQQKLDGPIRMLDFPSIDFSMIRYKAGWWNAWLKNNMKP